MARLAVQALATNGWGRDRGQLQSIADQTVRAGESRRHGATSGHGAQDLPG